MHKFVLRMCSAGVAPIGADPYVLMVPGLDLMSKLSTSFIQHLTRLELTHARRGTDAVQDMSQLSMTGNTIYLL